MRTSLRITSSKEIVLATISLLASIDFACTSSRLTNMWKDTEFKNSPMTNMLVIAAKSNPVNRRIWEDVIVAELSVHGVETTASYRLFADSIPDPDQVRAAIQEKKFDGVLFIRKLPTEISTSSVPGSIQREVVTRYDESTQTYSAFYQDVRQPGYSDTNKVVRHEASVFTTHNGGRLVWAGTGEMINPTSREAIRAEITGLVIPELARQGIIPAK
jgi:hypothetical protein